MGTIFRSHAVNFNSNNFKKYQARPLLNHPLRPCDRAPHEQPRSLEPVRDRLLRQVQARGRHQEVRVRQRLAHPREPRIQGQAAPVPAGARPARQPRAHVQGLEGSDRAAEGREERSAQGESGV